MLINRIKLYNWRWKWRKQNKQNETILMNKFDLDCVSVGRHTYGSINALTFNKESKLRIGDFCSIAENVEFIVSADHYVDRISTFPFKVKVLHERMEGVSKGDIIVDDDVWIGYGATIMSGVHIRQGAVVAAGAVVTKDIPPYAVVAGVPAKVIKYRFNEELIEEFLKVDFKKLDEEMIKEHIDDLYKKIEKKEQLAWLPQKNNNSNKE